MRDISSGVITELSKQLVRPFVACDIEFSDQTLHLWTGYGTLSMSVTGAIVGTQETNAGAWLWVQLSIPPRVPLAIGQQFLLSGLTGATHLNGQTVTVTDVLAANVFQANFSHANYGMTADTGTAALVGSAVDYLGVGDLAGVAPIVETSDVQANGVQLTLSGVPQGLLDESLGMCRQGMPITLLLGFLDSSGAVIADPIVAFVGRMDTVSVDEGADTATITVTAESRAVDHRAKIRRYTDDDQQRTNPGDKGFEFVPMVQDWNAAWGLHDRGR